jgi:small-conductance mechanosensitive channel/CRP-like cAMP-binding protein
MGSPFAHYCRAARTGIHGMSGAGYDGLMTNLLLGFAVLLVVLFGRMTRLELLRRFSPGLTLLSAALVGVAVADLTGAAEPWRKWTLSVLLIVLGYLLARALLLVVFEWLLAQRAGIEVPRLARDILAVAVYLAVAAVVINQMAQVDLGGLLATSAVITVVIGLALQETLGTLLAGLALTWERRVEAGVWLEVDGRVGKVEELGWRSTVLRTVLGERLLVPNSSIARTSLRLLGNGTRPVAVSVMVGVSYSAAPHDVKTVLGAVADDIPTVLPRPRPEILTREFADSSIVYECRLWTSRPWSDSAVRDPFLTRAYVALQRAGMEIPFPQRTLHVAPRRRDTDAVPMVVAALGRCPLFSGLPAAALELLAQHSHRLRFAPGEAVVRKDDASRALYVIAAGQVTVEVDGITVGSLETGNVFGEIAFLTGKPRTATVRAAAALEAVEIDSESLRALLADHPELANQLAERMALRQDRLDAAAMAASTPRERRGLVASLRENLLRLVSAGRGPDPSSDSGLIS